MLHGLGKEVTPKQIKTIMQQVDRDNSNSIEFREFAELMDKVNKGKIEVGASVFAQAIIDTKSALKVRTGLCHVAPRFPESNVSSVFPSRSYRLRLTRFRSRRRRARRKALMASAERGS